MEEKIFKCSLVNEKRFFRYKCKIEERIAEKNIVVVRWIYSGNHDDKLMSVKYTGNKFSICVMNFYYFNNERKIIKDIVAEGMIGILRAIGIKIDDKYGDCKC